MLDRREYENSLICKGCGGLCCRSGGCTISPEQFKEFNIETLREIMSTNIVTIDWLDEDPRDGKDEFTESYFIRMREAKDDWFFKAGWGGRCVLHAHYGKCPFDLEHRPYEAAYMKPNPNRISNDTQIKFHATCGGDLFTRESIASANLKYHEIFEEYEEESYDFKYVDKKDIDYDKAVEKYLEIIQENTEFK